MSDELVQVWVRTEKGQVFGPLAPNSVELLIDNQIISGRVQVSLDGSNYVFPGRMPGIRMVFPKQLWGDNSLPPNELDQAWSAVVAPPPLPGAAAPGAAPRAGPGVPVAGPAAVMAGPGAAPRAGPGPMAGPGAKAHAQARPAARPPGVAPVASSPSGVRAAPPPVRSSASVAAAMGLPEPAAAAPPVRSSASGAATAGPPFASSPSQVQSEPHSSSPSSVAVAPLEELPAQGTLGEHSGRRLYFLAAAQDRSGLLTVQLADRAISVHFRKGSPDLVESNHPDDALHSFLIRQKLVGMEQLAQAQKEGARFGGELLPALFGLGLLNPNAAIEALTQRVGGLLFPIFVARDGSFSFQAHELPPHKAMPPGNRWQVYAEQVRKVPVPELKAQLAEALDFPVMRGSGHVPVADLRLSSQEARVYAQFDGTKTLNHFLSGPEGELALRISFMLAPCDLVAFAGTVVKTSPAPFVSSPSSVGPPPSIAPSVQAPVAPAPAAAPRVPAPPGAPSRPPGPPVVGAPPGPPRVSAPPGAPPVVGPSPAPARPPPVVTGPTPAPASVVPGPPVRSTVPGPPVPPRGPAFPGQPTQPAARPSAPPVVGPPVVGPPIASSPSVAARPVITAAGPLPSKPTPAPGGFDAEVRRLIELASTMKAQNHFEVLGLPKDAAAGAVKAAYFKAAKDYHPDTVPPGAPEALSKAKADIFARIGEAHRTLSDDALRKDYLAEVEAGIAGEKVDVSKILQSEEFFQKGKILVQARKYPEAVKMFDDCITLTPEDAELYTWRGYARFFTFPDKKVGFPEAMKDITNCLKRNPNVVAAHFHQGMIHKVLGDLANAKKHFQQTVKLDPKHIDAQRELRLMK